MSNAKAQLVEQAGDSALATPSTPKNIGISSGLFNSVWGKQYKRMQGKVFQLFPSKDPEAYFESPSFVTASEIVRTETEFVIKQKRHKIPFGSFVIYVVPLLHKMNRNDDEEPIVFGHIVIYSNLIVLIPKDNIDFPYRDGW